MSRHKVCPLWICPMSSSCDYLSSSTVRMSRHKVCPPLDMSDVFVVRLSFIFHFATLCSVGVACCRPLAMCHSCRCTPFVCVSHAAACVPASTPCAITSASRELALRGCILRLFGPKELADLHNVMSIPLGPMDLRSIVLRHPMPGQSFPSARGPKWPVDSHKSLSRHLWVHNGRAPSSHP